MKHAEAARRKAQSQAAKGPEAVSIKITKKQVEGVLTRQNAVNAATAELNTFLSGVVAGHGYDRVRVTQVDDVKQTLTLIPV